MRHLITLLFLPALFAEPLTLRYATYYGSANNDGGPILAVDRAGNLIVAGSWGASDFPVLNAPQPSRSASSDIVVMKIAPSGNRLWATYVAVTSQLTGVGRICVDDAGNIYLAGHQRAGVPVVTSAVFASLDPNGRLRYTKTVRDLGVSGMVFHPAAGWWIAGSTAADLGRANGLRQRDPAERVNGYFARLDPNNGDFVYTSYTGGDGLYDVAVDRLGNVLMTGDAFVNRLPLGGATTLGPTARGYVASVNPTANRLNWIRPLETNPAAPASLASAGNVIVVGGQTGAGLSQSAAPIMPVTTPGVQAFLVKFDLDGNPLYSTRLGSGYDGPARVAVDGQGRIYATGLTGLTTTTTPDAYIGTKPTTPEPPMLHILGANNQHIHGSYLDTSSQLECYDILPVEGDEFWLACVARGPGKPVTPDALQSAHKGGTDYYIARFRLGDGPVRPAFTATQVTNAASFQSGAVSPGEIVTIFSRNAGPAILAGTSLTPDRRIATMAGETRVLFDGAAAPVIYSVQGQVSAIVPYAVNGRAATTVEVEYKNVRSSAVSVPVTAAAPAFFTTGGGKGQVVAVQTEGCCNSAALRAAKGSILVLYATGEGETTPAGRDGVLAEYATLAEYPRPRLPVAVTIGGMPAEILYAGSAPGLVSGVMQLNVRIPVTAPSGEAVPITLTVGAASSPAGVTMAIQ